MYATLKECAKYLERAQVPEWVYAFFLQNHRRPVQDCVNKQTKYITRAERNNKKQEAQAATASFPLEQNLIWATSPPFNPSGDLHPRTHYTQEL